MSNSSSLSPSSAQRTQRFKERLDSGTPEDRALQQAYRSALQKRAGERGISLPAGRFGGGR